MSNRERESTNSPINSPFLDKKDTSGSASKLGEYIRNIGDENEKLKVENQKLIDSFKKETNLIKATCGEEIDCLRKALEDVTSSKIKLAFDNKNMREEQEFLNNKLKNESSSLNILKKETIEMQEKINNYRQKLEGYEALKQDYLEISSENNKNKITMKNDMYKCVELENRIATLTEEIDYYKRLNDRSKTTLETNIQNAANFDAKVNAKVEILKMQLTADFEHCKEELEKFYENKSNDVNKLNENLAIENMKLKKEIEEMRIDNFDKIHTINNLNNRISNINEFNENRNRQTENRLKEILVEKHSLKCDLESTINELSATKAEKAAIENELSEFRSILESETNRHSTGGGSSPKRKRICKINPTNEAKFDISAFTNDRVKLYCDEQCNGDYIKLMNDTDNPINLNEWKIEIVSDDFKDVYCFPNRFIKGKRVLNVWRKDALSVMDDEDNIRMNVALPDFSKSFSCELTNDMYEFEASFQLKRTYQRKFIKAHQRN